MQHPIDRLAELRAEIRRLQTEAEHIRAQIASGEVDRIGDEYSAAIILTIALRGRPAISRRMWRIPRKVQPVLLSTGGPSFARQLGWPALCRRQLRRGQRQHIVPYDQLALRGRVRAGHLEVRHVPVTNLRCLGSRLRSPD